VAAAGSDLSNFLGTLVPGDTGCLHGGTYTDGSLVNWTTDGTASNRIVLTEYPGETAEIVGTTLDVQGDYLTVKDLTVRDVPGNDGIALSGNGERVEHNEINHTGYSDTAGAGILLHSTAANSTVTRNYVHNVGASGGTLYHGIYISAGSGHVVTRNVFADIAGGYGIQVYPSPSNTIVAENTVVHSLTRAGIVVQSSGGNITVVNNIFANNATSGISFQACGSGCTVDNNITWGNALGGVGGSLAGRVTNNRNVDPRFMDPAYHVADSSPAKDTARAAFSYFADLDGVTHVIGTNPDLGAYER
jgi:parallel beta-helix repeat protein